MNQKHSIKMETFNNPFEQIANELNSIKSQLADLTEPTPKTEIISGETLCNRLEITRQTLGRWRAQKRVPFIQVGSIIRYDFPKIIEALENDKNTGGLKNAK